MNYCIHEEVEERLHKTAGYKARKDIDDVLEELGFCTLTIRPMPPDTKKKNIVLRIFALAKRQIGLYLAWRKACSPLQKGDLLFIQFPINDKTLLFGLLCRTLHRRGVMIATILHDLESMRYVKGTDISWRHRLNVHISEISILKHASIVIVHNDCMKKRIMEWGVKESSLISLGIFDYLIPGYDPAKQIGRINRNLPVVIAGNLRRNKVGYAYNLPDNCFYNLYGIDFTGRLPVGSHYLGAFSPDELPYLLEGSFGLVWDGDSEKTCSGIYGDYLRINNPHKASLYLASGLPLAVWSQSALAGFVLENNVGIVIDSIHELAARIYSLTDDEYAQMLQNVKKVGERLRAAYYSKTAIAECLKTK